MVHDPVAKDGEAAPDPLGVGRLDVVPAGEVERDPVVGEAAQCVEQLQHPLAGHPVADADGRGPSGMCAEPDDGRSGAWNGNGTGDRRRAMADCCNSASPMSASNPCGNLIHPYCIRVEGYGR